MGYSPVGTLMQDVSLPAHLGSAHSYGHLGMGMITPEGAMMSAQMLSSVKEK